MSYGVLHVEFVAPQDIAAHPLASRYARAPAPPPAPAAAPAEAGAARGLAMGKGAADLVVGLVGKAAESLIDAAALWAQPDVARLEDVAPVDAFYEADGRLAVEGGCLVFHDGRTLAGEGRSLLGVFQVQASADRSAFRFTVAHWSARQFQNEASGLRGLFTRAGERDIALKIEWLAPGTEGVGARTIFVEHLFSSIDHQELERLFHAGQRLPWMAVPQRPATAGGTPTMPMNLKVTLLETERPNQLSAWLLEQAKSRKSEIATLVQDAVRGALAKPGAGAGTGG